MRSAGLLWLVVWSIACAPIGEDAAPAHPDVLFVVIDTLRADRVSAYGYERPTTPQLDALAEVGVLFEDVTAPAPWTWPSHASLFTGEPPWVHGARLAPERADSPLSRATHDRFGLAADRLREDLPTLAERFTAGGYRSVALVVNDWLDPELGLLRGFERSRLLEGDSALIDEAHEAIADPDGRPLFLFLNVMTAHSPFAEGPGPWALGDDAFLDPARAPEWVRPYLTEDSPRGVHLAKQPPGENTSAELRYAAGELELSAHDLERIERLYDASVRGADFVLSRVVEAWAESRPHSVVVVTSDHGEAFGEHGLLGHAASVYSEVLRVPLVIAAPGRLPASRRVSAPVQLRDLHPTLLDLAGLDADERSLVALAAGDTAAPPEGPVVAAAERNPAYARLAGRRFDRDVRMHRDGDLGLLWSKGDPTFRELYDLRGDPRMRADLADQRPVETARLAEAARARLDADGEVEGEALAIPEAVAGRLRSLGYADRVGSR
jgi:arylsulfatase A-like enzyme